MAHYANTIKNVDLLLVHMSRMPPRSDQTRATTNSTLIRADFGGSLGWSRSGIGRIFAAAVDMGLVEQLPATDPYLDARHRWYRLTDAGATRAQEAAKAAEGTRKGSATVADDHTHH